MEESRDHGKVYSERIKAGRRVYFFDIKPTRSGDYYLVITERKWSGDEGNSEKHRIFLYKEDLNKFSSAINKAIDHMKNDLMPDFDFSKFDREAENLLESKNNEKEDSNDEDKNAKEKIQEKE
ncbi:MAG: PUR family DNA/RNA-binding protein [Bacteroidetes bacterium]|nr:PUR family DNA/RNA-binding protein [Bacteroidota bacterium]